MCVCVIFLFIPCWRCLFFTTQLPSSSSSNGLRQGPQWEEPGLQKWRPSLAQSIWWGHWLPAEWKRVTTPVRLVSWPHCCHAEITQSMRQFSVEWSTMKMFNFKKDTHSLEHVAALQLHSDIEYYRASADVSITSQLHPVFHNRFLSLHSFNLAEIYQIIQICLTLTFQTIFCISQCSVPHLLHNPR